MLTTLTRYLPMLALPIGLSGMLAAAKEASRGRMTSAAGRFAGTAGVVAFLFIGPQYVVAAVTRALGLPEPATQAAAPKPAPVVPPAASGHSTTGGPSIPWYALELELGAAIVVGVLVLGAVLLAAAFVVRGRYRAMVAAHAESDAVDAQRTQLWESVTARHNAVLEAWADYRQDIGAILAQPALNDVRVPATASFVDACGRAQDLRQPTCPAADAAVATYESAVRELERSWQGASANAARVGRGGLSAQERRRIEQAVDLLAMAENAASTPAERQSCYKRVTVLLAGIVTLPKEAVAALESAARLAVTAA